MITFVALSQLATIQISELSAARACELFGESSSDYLYVNAGKVLVGVLNRKDFFSAGSRVEGLETLNARYKRISVTEPFRPRDLKQRQELRNKAVKIFLESKDCDHVVQLGRGGNLHGVFIKQPSAPRERTITEYADLRGRGWRGLGGYLREHGCQNVGVYSPGKDQRTRDLFDTMVIQELAADPRIHVSWLITNTLTSLAGLPTCSLDEISNHPDLDAIVVIDDDMVDDVKFRTQQMENTTVLPVSRIVGAVYALEVRRSDIVEQLHRIRQKGCRVLLVETPAVERLKRKSPYEQLLVSRKIFSWQDFLDNVDEVFDQSCWSPLFSKEDWLTKIRTGLSAPTPYRDYVKHVDIRSELENVVDGMRMTAGVPDHPRAKIKIFGDSVTFGRAVPDEYSVASRLQFLLNERGENIGVENFSMSAAVPSEIASRLRDAEFEDSDSVIVSIREGNFSEQLNRLAEENDIPVYRARGDFEANLDGDELFVDMHHLSFVGTDLLARRIDSRLSQLSDESDVTNRRPFHRLYCIEYPIEPCREYFDPIVNSKEFRAYLHGLEEMRETVRGVVGSIVVNCNPFTLGHQFLIETAASQCDLLYVFVVEEDRSVFPYKERLDLVRKGTAHLNNVRVLPSGNFIISALTFPEYFMKGQMQEDLIDPSLDVELFGKRIAPALGITRRIVGEEPLDRVTSQYNQAMAKILPRFGIDVEIIQRKEQGDQVISASRVRKHLENQDFESIAKLVPQTTLDYLKDNFGDPDIAATRLKSDSQRTQS
ncbi:MAG: adenylyltransferase/cytidyltransferase family protein [Propionibacteriaceae bacterium]|nr:adenylyltransferase/cytidyltransferase family protein [Propionibacteriaceae bacterium]